MFTVIATSGNARAGVLHLAHGAVETPLFMPTATRAALRGVLPRDAEESGTQMLLVNAFHLMLSPGVEQLKHYGGVHGFMGWNKPILTDSGGYQIFSLAKFTKVSSAGVTFRSPLDGSSVFVSPEDSIAMQREIGADIIMCLDECTPYPVPRKKAYESMILSIEWARRCKQAKTSDNQLLLGIVQGSVYPPLRLQCLNELEELSFDGYALGGLSVGEPREQMLAIVDYMAPRLPASSVRYLMGVGTPVDLVEAIVRGMDIFDCVLPTRNGRNGQLFTRFGTINVRNAKYKGMKVPPDEECLCYCCRNFTLGYLHHLFRLKEMGAAQLASIHNIFYYHQLLSDIRIAIKSGKLSQYVKNFYRHYQIN